MLAQVHVTLKQGVLDPQGEAVAQALRSLQYRDVANVRQGKYFEVQLNQTSKPAAEKIVKEICEKLLANTVIEDYRFEVVES